MRHLALFLVVGLCLSLTNSSSAQIPTTFTDKVSQGSGVIDMLIDVGSAELSQYLESGTLYLGVDLNEDAKGNESRSSVGIAIQQLELVIQTTNGEVSFSDYYTNTTAMIRAEGETTANEYYTMFGTMGSSQITGSGSGFDISDFDDVIQVQNIDITGEILSAELRVTFLDTAATGENETFFDYSDGFEDFAIFSSQDAAILDGANLGLSEAPTTLTFDAYADISAASGAPLPAWYALACLPVFIIARQRFHAKR